MTRIYEMPKLTPEAAAAVKKFAAEHGRAWKAELRRCWERSHYPGMDGDDPAWLQSLRNIHGPKWLTRVNLDKHI